MKKLPLALISLAIAGTLLMPYFTGKIAERETNHLVSNMNHHFAAYGNTEVVDYQRSYKSTQASYKLTLNEAPPVEVNYACTGEHGFIDYQYSCALQDMPQYQDWVAENLDGKDPITISGSVSALGKIEQHIDLESFSLFSGKDEIKVAKGRLTINSNQEVSDVQVHGEFDGARLINQDADVSFENLAVNAEFLGGKTTLPLGEFNLRAEKLQLESPEEGSLSLSNLELDAWTKVEGASLSSGTEFSVAKAQYPSQKIAVEDLSWHFDVSGVPVAKLNDLQQQLKTLNVSQSASGANSLNNPAFNTNNFSKDLSQLLVPGLALSTAAQGVINNQTNIIKLGLELLEPLEPQDAMLIMFDPVSLLKKVAFEINLQLSNRFLASAKLTDIISQNDLFTHNGEVHSLSITTNKTTAELNGESMNLEAFVNKIMSSSL
jgi:hypothetical protein